MFTKLMVSTIWVTDLNEALRFYTEKLGFEIRSDVKSGDYRWLTIGLQGQPDIEFHFEVAKPGALLNQEEADFLAKLIVDGKFGTGPWKTDNCHAAYETLTARGVEFVQPPIDRPYGTIEAIFKDNSGNVMVLSQDKS